MADRRNGGDRNDYWARWCLVGGANALSQLTVGDLLAASSELHPIEATKELCGDL